jgi:hypothetical protein
VCQVSFRAFGILLLIKALDGSDDSELSVQWDEKTRRSQGYHIYQEI